jgi:uroporphyrinogen decarboxylase
MPVLGTGSRGPATIMTSVLNAETLFFWMYDHPELVQRLRDILAQKMVEFNTILRQFSGNNTLSWWITDDNSALFNKRLYKEFCVPVLERVLTALAPGAETYRYQHSDSAMGHLLDFQRELGINSVNYGPDIDPAYIREKMPNALINGQIPPMLVRNGSPAEIQAKIISDFQRAGAGGGLNITTAGSLAAGTGVGRMRWLMQCVEQCCRYDR